MGEAQVLGAVGIDDHVVGRYYSALIVRSAAGWPALSALAIRCFCACSAWRARSTAGAGLEFVRLEDAGPNGGDRAWLDAAGRHGSLAIGSASAGQAMMGAGGLIGLALGCGCGACAAHNGQRDRCGRRVPFHRHRSLTSKRFPARQPAVRLRAIATDGRLRPCADAHTQGFSARRGAPTRSAYWMA